jgi:D-arabinose 1-dehydrogenase-like Zn-dependent alcohol dehydrogenase
MRAVVCDGAGDVDVMRIGEVPEPVAGEGQVVIDVVGTAVNRADVLQRQGSYPPPPGASDVLGLECSGRISALGDGVSRWQVGDEVTALLSGGGYAEQVAVPAGQVLPVPAGVDLQTAAALPEVACTVWSNVFMLAGLQPGETLLVHGGSSGIGTMAIQLAVAMGARVAVTAGSAEKLQRCRELGADILVNYRDDDFVEDVRAATGAMAPTWCSTTWVPRTSVATSTSSLSTAAGGHRPAGRRQGRAQPGQAPAEAGRRAGHLAAGPPRRGEGGDRGRRRGARLAAGGGRLGPPGGARGLRLTDVREAHRCVEDSAHVGKVLLRI